MNEHHNLTLNARCGQYFIKDKLLKSILWNLEASPSSGLDPAQCWDKTTTCSIPSLHTKSLLPREIKACEREESCTVLQDAG